MAKPKHFPRAARSTFALEDFLNPTLVHDCKIIGKRTNNSTAEVINACIRYTLNVAGALNALFPFAAAMAVPQNAPPPVAPPGPQPAPAPPAEEEQSNETAEERLAKARAIANGEEPPASERETPVVGTPAEPS